MDAAAIVGQLAEADRRRVFAALVLGAASLDEIRRDTGLELRGAVAALGRLVDAGLVLADDDRWYLVEAAFAAAARAAAPTVPAATDDNEQTLRNFVREGRLVQIPMQRPKRLVVLDRLAQEFEPGRRFSESMVNLILGRWHADTAALRRYLVDEGFLDRAGGEYWRSGGTVEPPAAPIRVTGLDHVVLVVTDMERSVAWYRDRLGLEPVRLDEWRRGEAPFVSMRIDDATIVDLQLGTISGTNVDHVAFLVDSLEVGDVPIERGPSDLFGARGIGRGVYVRDPDGHRVELRTYP